MSMHRSAPTMSPISSNNLYNIFSADRLNWNRKTNKSVLCLRDIIKHLNYKKGYFLLWSTLLSQSMAWSSPSPLVADVLKIWKVRFFSASRPSAWWTSATDRHPSISCLFASTSNTAPASSSSRSIYSSSSFDIPIRSLSAESTT